MPFYFINCTITFYFKTREAREGMIQRIYNPYPKMVIWEDSMPSSEHPFHLAFMIWLLKTQKYSGKWHWSDYYMSENIWMFQSYCNQINVTCSPISDLWLYVLQLVVNHSFIMKCDGAAASLHLRFRELHCVWGSTSSVTCLYTECCSHPQTAFNSRL